MRYQDGGDELPREGIWKSSQLFPKVDEEEALPPLLWCHTASPHDLPSLGLQRVGKSSGAALLAVACWNKLKCRGKVIKVSSISTIPRRPEEAEALSDHVITTASHFRTWRRFFQKHNHPIACSPFNLELFLFHSLR